MARKMFRHIVTVSNAPRWSSGARFPIDMLRYDGVYPFSEADSNIVQFGGTLQVRSVKVARTADADWKPTAGRWESFGWQVIEHTKDPIN